MENKKKRPALARRAWNLVRLALLWARKGGVLRQKLVLALRHILSHTKTLGRHSDRIHYGDRELSFDETPVFRFNMHRPASMRHLHIPCIQPEVDSDNDDNNDSIYFRRSFFSRDVTEEYDQDSDDDGCHDQPPTSEVIYKEEEEEEEKAVDEKAEEFIAEFYNQMKLQRQISYLEYHEMLHRSMS